MISAIVRGAVARLMRLPAPATFSFLPYPEATPQLAQQAASAGFEVFLHMPMEPIGDEYPGPGALMVDADAAENSSRLMAALDRVPWAVGINNHMGQPIYLQCFGHAPDDERFVRARLSISGQSHHWFVGWCGDGRDDGCGQHWPRCVFGS